MPLLNLPAHLRHLTFSVVQQASFPCALANFVMAMLGFGWHAPGMPVVRARGLAMLGQEPHGLVCWPLKHANADASLKS